MVQFLDVKNSGFQQFSQMKNTEQKRPSLFKWALIALIAYWVFMPKPKNISPVQTEPAQQIDISNVPRSTIASDKIAATIQGLRISNINLEGFKAGKDAAENIELLSKNKEFIEIGILANGTTVPSANSLWKISRSPEKNTMSWKSDSGAQFIRTVSADNYLIIVTDEIKNQSKKPIYVSQYGRIVREGGSKVSIKTGGITDVNGDIKTKSWDDITNKSEIYQTTANESAFIGFSDQYWETIVSSAALTDKTIKIKHRGDKIFQSEIAPEFTEIGSGKTKTFITNIFAGPKTQEALTNASIKIANIDRTIDYGWFGFLSRPFLWTLNKLHNLIPNYGIAIILLTLIMRMFMWPLSKKSMRSMRAMQVIQPEMQRIQKLYANDKMRLQQEILKLYQTHKANPLASIGIMFLQIPIFFALYKALLVAVPLRHAGFLWISDLSIKDPYYILPILMALTMWMQNKMNKSLNTNQPGTKFVKYFPFIFAFLFSVMPSGLVLYWTISSIVGIIQMKVMKK